VFIILQIIKNKANHHPTRHHAENCINSLAPSVGNDKSFLAKINKFRMVTYDQITSLINKSGFAWIWAYMQNLTDLFSVGTELMLTP
jgi:hypothetical protein